MTDLEHFIEFFTMKGVPFHLENDPDTADSFVHVSSTDYQFDDDGKFIGTYTHESLFAPRIPAKEGE